MAYIPATFLGRFVLISLILLYILLLTLNLVSFGGLQWITYVDYNVQFGLWRVCNGAASKARTCQQWSSSRNILDPTTSALIFAGKPGFIQASQGLEIVSLIFYVFAGIFIIVGILDLKQAPLEIMFGIAAVLLFLCIIFLSASLGLMSKQGRNNQPTAYLDWAWWIGMIGLIITIIFVILLIGFTIHVAYFSHEDNNFNQFNAAQLQLQLQQQQQLAYFYPSMSYQNYNQWYPPSYQSNISPLMELLGQTELQRQQQWGYPYEQTFFNSYF